MWTVRTRLTRSRLFTILGLAGSTVLRLWRYARPYFASGVPMPLLWAALAMTGSQPAEADVRDFPFTYEWYQNSKGERELAYHSAYLQQSNAYIHEIEFEYGVTSRFSVAPYIVFKHGNGRSLHYDGVKLETRYKLGNFKPNRVLAGLYLELEQANREAIELEGKLIFSQYDRHGGNISLNLILHRQFGSGDKLEPAYSFGIARSVKDDVRGGVEWLHDINTGRINAGPVVSFNVGNIHVATGYAFPVNRNAGNKGELRLLAEHHF